MLFRRSGSPSGSEQRGRPGGTASQAPAAVCRYRLGRGPPGAAQVSPGEASSAKCGLEAAPGGRRESARLQERLAAGKLSEQLYPAIALKGQI